MELATIFEQIKDQVINRYVNNLKEYNNIKYIVATCYKCGTSAISDSLQKCCNNDLLYQNVIHCHQEECWYNCVHSSLKDRFKLYDVIELCNINNVKPIVFQLYREPIARIISSYMFKNRIEPSNHELNHDKLMYHEPYTYKLKDEAFYYEETFKYKLSELQYNHEDGCLCVDKENYYLFFVKMDDFPKLGDNLRKYFPTNTDFDKFELLRSNEYIPSEERDEFKKNIRFTRERFDQIFEDSKYYMTFYYTNEQIEEIKRKYLDGELKIVN